MDQHLKIAIVGGGVAGITAAHLLQRKHAVSLYEKNSYVGYGFHEDAVRSASDVAELFGATL